MLSFECIKNEKSVYFLLTSAAGRMFGQQARRRGTGCPKASSREAKYSRSWAANTEKRYRLPKTKSAGSQYMPAKSQLTA